MGQALLRENEIETYTFPSTDNPSAISMGLRIADWMETAIKEHIKIAGRWDLSADVAASQFDPLVQGRYGVTIAGIVDENGIYFDVIVTFHDRFANLCKKHRFGKGMLLRVPKDQSLSFDAIKFYALPSRFDQKPQERDSFIEKLDGLQRSADMGFMPVKAATRLNIEC